MTNFNPNQSESIFVLFNLRIVSVYPPVRYTPLVTEQVPLHSKSQCKNMTRASGFGGGANDMHPLSWGRAAQTEKIIFLMFLGSILFRPPPQLSEQKNVLYNNT